MMKEFVKSHNRLKLNLQLFAEPGDGAEPGAGSGAGSGSGGGEPSNGGAGSGSAQKTFTQEEVNAMMAAEKRQGKNSVLKELGFEDLNKAKEAIQGYNQYLETQKTTEQKNQEALQTAQKDKEAAENRAKLVEYKLEAIKCGVRAEAVDDAVALAALRVSDTKDIKAVIEEMKGQEVYSSFFNTTGSTSKGTTGKQPPAGGTGGTGGSANSMGQRLAENRKGKSPQSSYFKR